MLCRKSDRIPLYRSRNTTTGHRRTDKPSICGGSRITKKTTSTCIGSERWRRTCPATRSLVAEGVAVALRWGWGTAGTQVAAGEVGARSRSSLPYGTGEVVWFALQRIAAEKCTAQEREWSRLSFGAVVGPWAEIVWFLQRWVHLRLALRLTQRHTFSDS